MPRSSRSSASRAAARTAAPPLGSLTQRSAVDEVLCQGCGSPRVTHIGMQLTDGSSVTLTSCHVCQHRSWVTIDGDELPVTTVLDRARKLNQ